MALQVLRHLLRSDTRMRLLVLATYRDTEEARSALLSEVVSALARPPEVCRIELGPQAGPAGAAILAGAGRPAELAAPIHGASHGNAFFVGELVRSLDEAEGLTPRGRALVPG